MFREIIRNKKNAIFILPYVSLVQEKVRHWISKLTYYENRQCDLGVIKLINLYVHRSSRWRY